MKFDSTQWRQYAPYLAPVIIVALGWALLVRPVSNESSRTARELEGLRQRLNSVRSDMTTPLPPDPKGDLSADARRAEADPMQSFERQVAVGDPSGRLLEELTRLAGKTGVRVNMIETVEQATATFGSGPSVTSAAIPDPRLALFEAPLNYSPVNLVADADYQSLGEFLWQLRGLATMVEIRSLEITRPVESPAQVAVLRGSLRVSLTLFAYSRSGDPGSGSRGSARNLESTPSPLPAPDSRTPAGDRS